MKIHQEELISDATGRVVPHVLHTALGGLRHVPGLDPAEATKAWKEFARKSKPKSSPTIAKSSPTIYK